MKRSAYFLLIYLFVVCINLQAQTSELNIIKQNYKQLILSENEGELISLLMKLPKETIVSDQMVVELMERYPLDSVYINTLLRGIQEDGSWTDINYTDKTRSGWDPRNHTTRILDLAKAYSSSNNHYYQSKTIASAIHKTLEFWFTKKLVCPNWWYNQIGVPKTLGAAFILFENELSDNEKLEAITVMNNAKFGMTGQNKVWLAGIVLVKGLLMDDINLVKASRDTILSEIVTGRVEGIKADCSFHQHGAQQQFGNYGAAYLASMSFWGSVFNKTSLAIEQDKLDIISNLVNKGYQRILWKGYMDINALGRQFFKQAQLHKGFSVEFSANMLANIDVKNQNKYKELLKDNLTSLSKGTVLTGLYHFWLSDQTVQRRPQWMASVKMSSRRVIGTESGNGDNLLGYYLADGACYTYVDGDEYNDIFPTWNWRKIPGTTVYDTDAPLKQVTWSGYQNKNQFVGNVNNGEIGLTAMRFKRDGLEANKAWLFTNDFVLCLGAAIKADSGCMVTTSIDQRLFRANSDLLYLNGKQWEKVLDKEWKSQANQRFFHDKTGYIVLSKNNGKAAVENKVGKWNSVMAMYTESVIAQNKVFTIWLEHGVDPKNETYQYLIIPASTPEQVKQFDVDAVKVVKNDDTMQAIDLPKLQVAFIAAYKTGSFKINNKINFKNLNPGLFLIEYSNNKIIVTVTDPTQLLETVEFEINGKPHKAKLPIGDKKGTPIEVKL